jgi:hypothetical protein
MLSQFLRKCVDFIGTQRRRRVDVSSILLVSILVCATAQGGFVSFSGVSSFCFVLFLQVDETLTLVDGVLPKVVKEKSYQAYDVAKQAPDAARAVVAEVQNQGLYETAAIYYQKYEPAAEQLTYIAWQKILTVPLVPQAVHLAAPAAKFGAQSYNNLATTLKGKQLPFAEFIPLVPIERIEEATKTVPAQ